MLLPNLLNANPSLGVVQWLTHLPRYFFFLGLYFTIKNHPGVFTSVNKMIVIFSFFTVLQYISLIILGEINRTYWFDIPFGGPWGIFGKLNKLSPLNLDPIYRLCGFFNEPSNASAFLFCSYFISKTICQNNMVKKWKFMGRICLVGGFFCLSNAGYIAIASAFIFSSLFVNSSKNVVVRITKIVLPLCVILFGLFGRIFIVNNNIESERLRVVSGVSKLTEVDFSAYRLEKIDNTFELISNRPFGTGYKEIGQLKTAPPAGAPFLWLLWGGVPAIILLGLREMNWIYPTLKRTNILTYEKQALIAVVIQQSIYGEWNNAFYYFLVATLLAKLTKPISNISTAEE